MSVTDSKGESHSAKTEDLLVLDLLSANDNNTNNFNEDAPIAAIYDNGNSLLGAVDANVLDLIALESKQTFVVFDPNNEIKT